MAAALALISALVVYQLKHSEQQAQNAAEQSAQRLALSLESYLLSHLRSVDIVLDAVADDITRRRAAGPVDADDLSRALELQRTRLQSTDALRATDAAGNVVYGPGRQPGQVVNVADRDYFKQVQRSSSLVISLPLKSRITGQWVLPVARGVRDADGRFAGMVYAFTNTQRIRDVFASLNTGNDGVVTLFDADRRILLRHPALPQDDPDAPPTLNAAPTLAALAQGRTEATYRTRSSVDNIDRVLSLRRVGDYPLYVIVGVARDDYLAAWRRELAIGAALLAALAATALALVLLQRRAWQRRDATLAQLRQQEARLQRTVDSLTRSEARFRALTDGLPQMVWTSRADGSVEFFSPHWTAYTGLSAEQLLDRSQRRTAMHPDDLPAALAAWSVALATGVPFQTRCRIRHHTGQWRVFDSRALPQRDDNGHIVGWVGSNTDITEAQLAHDAALAARAAADEANQAKSGFLAMMSHELRTPLNGVMGFAHLGLRDADASERSQQNFNRILDSSRLLLNLVNDLLDLSKIEAGKLTLETLPVALPPLLASSVDLLRERATQQGIGLLLDMAATLPPVVLADPLRLQQVLLNLLSNAVKFTEEGHVAMLVERQGDELMVVVEDTGIGMTPEQLARMYRPFEQADEGTSRRFGGTGLGLAITQRLVALMGGRLDACSTPGQGSRFELRLPCRLPPADGRRQASAEAVSATTGTPHAPHG